jgi:NAD(P)-dependent dehydrogenase (short-subunit alcohol dehydrogenase family)
MSMDSSNANNSTNTGKPITGRSSIGEWLSHPVGGPLLRELLAQAGQDEQVLAPVRNFPLEQMVALSQGQMSQALIDDLVRRANGGVMPEVGEEAADQTAGWAEKIVPSRFNGQTVIVTGAGSGIGRATASRIAREGGRVVAVDISAERLEDLASAHPGLNLVTLVADITSNDAVGNIVAAANGRIDGLANVAGIGDDMTPLHEVSDAVWSRVWSVNVDGLFRLTRAVLPVMLDAGRGSIVNVASEASLRGSAAGAAYTTSKHAVVGLTRSAAFMYGPLGIRVNAIAPGGVATAMTADFASELGRQRLGPQLALIPPIAQASQLAASITFLLSDDGTNINGAILPSDGGWSVQ